MAYKEDKREKVELTEKNKPQSNTQRDNITLVTAYFLLPPFRKGKVFNFRKPQHYIEWMNAYSWVVNPLIIYLDNQEVYYLVKDMFKHNKNKHIKFILIKRDQLWIFRQKSIIAKIFKQPNYPVHYPNTVIPEYNCVSHAKFELLKWSIEQNYYHTKYFIWIDIGYFRMRVQNTFGLSLPPDFDERKVVLSQVEDVQNFLTLEEIVQYNLNWVAGGAILGRYDVLRKFCLKYLLFIKQSLEMGIIGAEQQMLYAMYSDSYRMRKEDIQICSEGWFCLGHLAVATWLQERNSNKLRRNV